MIETVSPLPMVLGDEEILNWVGPRAILVEKIRRWRYDGPRRSVQINLVRGRRESIPIGLMYLADRVIVGGYVVKCRWGSVGIKAD